MMARSRRRISRIAAAAALTSALVVGCAYQEPAPPAPAPAPRSVTITALRKQSQAHQDRDSAECQSQASAQATSSQEWVVIFSSCMSGRGYRVE